MKRTISQPVGFDGKEIQGYFMISNKDAASAILNKLTGSQVRLWLYLMMIDTYADFTSNGETIYHPIPSPTEMSFKLGVARDTVQKDMRKLKKLGLYDYRITNWQGHNSAAAKAKQESNTLKRKKSQSASEKSNGRGQGNRKQTVAHQDSGQSPNSKPRHPATPPKSQELNNPHQGLNNPSSPINPPQTKSGESDGLISPSQGLNNPQQGLINPSQGLNNPQQGLISLAQPSKCSSDKGSGLSQTIQTDQTSQTIQKGVGVENSGSGSDLDSIKEETSCNEQSYSLEEEVKEQKLVDKKDSDKDQSSADVVQATTKRATKSVNSDQLPVSSEQSPRHPVTQSPNADIPEDLISKLKDLGISLDGEVRRAIADHDMSQAYGAIKHVENTWETINNPRGVFLHQIPNQRVQKGPKPISENFLEWYQWAIADGLVIDYPVKYLSTNSRGEPKVKLTIDPGWAEDWKKVRDNPDDYRQKLDPIAKKKIWAKVGSMFKRTPEPEPETTLNDQLSDPILAEELYPKIKHSHQVDFTEEGRPYQATPIADIKYDENGVPVEEVK